MDDEKKTEFTEETSTSPEIKRTFDLKSTQDAPPEHLQPNYVLRTQLFVCLFLAAVLFFTWQESGELWLKLSYQLKHLLNDGVSFSGQEDLTRFTDEVRGFWGNVVDAFRSLV